MTPWVGADGAVPASGQVDVLYVGGLPRSGSTLTDLLLHHLEGHVGVGELFYLWRNCVIHDGLCACGERFSVCPFWLAVGQVAYGGWDQIDPHEAIRLQAIVDTTAAVPLLVSPWRPRRFTDALVAYTAMLSRLYLAITEVSGAGIVVDSSKRSSMAFVLRLMPDIDLRVVQVVRDPRGVAFSFDKLVPLEPGVALKEQMPRSKPRKVGRRWVTVNASVAALARFGVPLVRVRYEDLVQDPRVELERILVMEGIDPAGQDFSFLTPDGVVVPRTHAIASGRIRLQQGVVPLVADNAWRATMPARSRRLVSAITALTRRRYGY
jgi:hypothetical protein